MKRSYIFDNLKIFMIILVVFGHSIEPFIIYNDFLKVLYMFIYSFHMPVFIIVAGMLTKLEYSKDRTKRNVETLLVPFIAFTALYEVFNIIITNEISRYTLNMQPFWMLWFLFSLFIWKTLLPSLIVFKYPFLLSLLIAIVVGVVNDVGYFLGVSRTLYFFPFFILGYKIKDYNSFKMICDKIPKFIYVIVIISSATFFWIFQDFSIKWLFGSFSFEKLDYSDPLGLLVRTVIVTISIISAISIIRLTSCKENYFTRFGQNSLYVFLWHGFFIKLGTHLGLVELLTSIHLGILLVILMVFALILTMLLSSNIVADATENLIFKPTRRLMFK